MADERGRSEVPVEKTRVEESKNNSMMSAALESSLTSRPSANEVKTSKDHAPRELTPAEIFEKVALNDSKQNERLSAKSNGSSSPFKRVKDGHQSGGGDGASTRMRFIICTLGLVSLAMSQMSRMVLNQSITEMVDPSMQAPKKNNAPVSSPPPWPEDEKGFSSPSPTADRQEVTTWPSYSPPATTLAPEPPTVVATTTSPEVAVTITSAPTASPTTTSPPSFTEAPTEAQTVRSLRELLTTPPDGIDPQTESPSTTREPMQPATNAADIGPLPLDNSDDDDHENSTGQDRSDLSSDATTNRPKWTETREDKQDETMNELPDFIEDDKNEIEGTDQGPTTTTASPQESTTTKSETWGPRRIEKRSIPDDKDPDELAPTGPGNEAYSAMNGSQVVVDKYPYPRYRWTMQQQNTLLGGFYYSYFVFMVLGGRMAEIYGAKYVLLLSVAGSALINLATPWMANTSFTLLVVSRIIMGAIQSGVFPGMYALIAKWLTMTEASIYAPLIKMNLRLGMVLGSLIPGIASGWPNVFYLTGILSAIWSILWLAIATSDPADNKWVSPSELAHINRKKKKVQADDEPEALEMETKSSQGAVKAVEAPSKPAASSKKTPWVKILTAPSVIGLIIVKLTFNYALDFLAIELPSYLKYVHHASMEKISAITTPMFAIQVFLIVFVGWLAKVTIQARPLGLDKTGIRKLFQGLASFGLSATFFLLTFNNGSLLYVTIMLQIMSFLSMFTAGGETMLPYDLSLEYPATIMAIANSVANLSGITTTTLAGLVLGSDGGSSVRWNILINLIAGANLIGGLCFMFLVKAEPIDFSKTSKKEKNQEAVDLEAAATKFPSLPKN